MCYGDLPTNGFGDPGKFKFPRGAILDRDLSKIHEVDAHDPQQVKESIAHSWYEYSDGDAAAKHPWDGETKLNYTGPQPPYDQLNVDGKYSWLKTPRWNGHAMEVGPLARMLVGYGSGPRRHSGRREHGVEKTGRAGGGAVLHAWPHRRARHRNVFGRAVGAGILRRPAGEHQKRRLPHVQQRKMGAVHLASRSQRRRHERSPARRAGALDRHQRTRKSRTTSSSCLRRGTPRRATRQGQRSAYESSLIGTPVADPEKPLEIIRTIHSFDPCLACAVHLYDPQGRTLNRVTVGG